VNGCVNRIDKFPTKDHSRELADRHAGNNTDIAAGRGTKVTTARPNEFIRQSNRRMPQRLLYAIFALSILCIGIADGLAWAQGGPPAAPVVVAPVIEREVASFRSFVGNVNPNRQSMIGSAVDGRVVEYLIRAGQQVEEGQPLAKLRTGTID
jgi:hypothetical protein